MSSYKCPYCNRKMDDAGEDWWVCPDCEWGTDEPKEAIPFVLECLKKYDAQKNKERDV